MFQAPPRGRTANFQMNTMAPPPSIPARAPQRLARRQNRAHSTTAPKAPPKPAQAKETIWNTEELGSRARITPMTEITSRVSRAKRMPVLSLIFRPNTPFRMFSDTEEEAASSWLSQVDMVQARMPAMTTPASSAGRMPKVDSLVAMAIRMRSESSTAAMAPLRTMAMPSTPMKMAMPMAMVTQMEPTRRLTLSFLGSWMPMNRSRMWGMPK